MQEPHKDETLGRTRNGWDSAVAAGSMAGVCCCVGTQAGECRLHNRLRRVRWLATSCGRLQGDSAAKAACKQPTALPALHRLWGHKTCKGSCQGRPQMVTVVGGHSKSWQCMRVC